MFFGGWNKLKNHASNAFSNAAYIYWKLKALIRQGLADP